MITKNHPNAKTLQFFAFAIIPAEGIALTDLKLLNKLFTSPAITYPTRLTFSGLLTFPMGSGVLTNQGVYSCSIQR
jgi:hypothetical protein